MRTKSPLSLIAYAVLIWTSFVWAACSSEVVDDSSVGSIVVALDLDGVRHDVAGAEYKIVAADDRDGCEGEALAATTTSLEGESLPEYLDPDDGDGDNHPFADALFVLPPGRYLACARPVTEEGEPSDACGSASQRARVFAERTTEIVMISQCRGNPNGALDVVLALNDPPVIDDLEILPSKFITTCELARIRVDASDPNGDDLRYRWYVTQKPHGFPPWLHAMGPHAKFFTRRAGEYQLKVKVMDPHDRATSLTFPIHVSEGGCSPCGPRDIEAANLDSATPLLCEPHVD